MSASENKNYTCPLCGHRFIHDDEHCHACPLSTQSKCNVVCCPNCGYSFSEDSRVVDWFRKVLGRKKAQEQTGEDKKNQ